MLFTFPPEDWNNIIPEYNVSAILDALKEFFAGLQDWLASLIAAWEDFDI